MFCLLSLSSVVSGCSIVIVAARLTNLIAARHILRGVNYVKILYALSATVTLALGLLHMATTFTLSLTPSGKVWFFGAGMAIAFCGVVNLLNRRYGQAAVGLWYACIGINLLMVCFAAVAGRVTGASVAEQVVMLALLASALILSAMPSSSTNPRLS